MDERTIFALLAGALALKPRRHRLPFRSPLGQDQEPASRKSTEARRVAKALKVRHCRRGAGVPGSLPGMGEDARSPRIGNEPERRRHVFARAARTIRSTVFALPVPMPPSDGNRIGELHALTLPRQLDGQTVEAHCYKKDRDGRDVAS